MYYDDGQRLQSLPLAWTSLAPTDPFEVVAAGRALFRTDTLLRLVAVLRDLDETARAEAVPCLDR